VDPNEYNSFPVKKKMISLMNVESIRLNLKGIIQILIKKNIVVNVIKYKKLFS